LTCTLNINSGSASSLGLGFLRSFYAEFDYSTEMSVSLAAHSTYTGPWTPTVKKATDITGKMPWWGTLLIVLGVFLLLALFTVYLFVCSKKRDVKYRNAQLIENAESNVDFE